MNKELLTPKEIMEALGISRSTLWRMVQSGKIEQINITSRIVRYRASDIRKLAGEDSSSQLHIVQEGHHERKEAHQGREGTYKEVAP